MLARPENLSDAVLVETLLTGWDLNVRSLEYRPVGFGSHHWAASDTSGDRWFVTVDDLRAKRHSPNEPADAVFERLRAALATAHALRVGGMTFVVAPLSARDGVV